MKKEEVQDCPLVSIFIPAYNAGQFVAQAIDSVLAQTYSNYELIIIDDGSTDDTALVLKAYQSHPKITIQRNPKNVGMAANWNIGLGLCQGEFIAKLDADDFYEPGYLEAVVKVFQKNKTVGLVFSGLNLIYSDGHVEPEMISLRSWVRNRQNFLPTLLQLCVIRSPTVCVRRSCYDQLGGFIEQMQIHADWEMWVRIVAHYPIGFIARRLANYRMNYGSNCTAQAAFDGRSKNDLRLWLNLLKNNELPYRLSAAEQDKLRWGIYAIEMHFAGTAAYYKRAEMQKAYTAFAEEVLPNRPSPSEMERMRQVYINLHQGLCAFQEQKLKEARYYFLQAIKIGPAYCKSFWIWSKLLLTFVGRTKWGIIYK
jgi:glycosyltransferase involved in cell wall biosynthesis